MGTLEQLFFRAFGGGTRDRTADLLHAMQALSQLSYTPGAAKEGRIVETVFPLVKGFSHFFRGFFAKQPKHAPGQPVQ
jgi:hypothetical protein